MHSIDTVYPLFNATLAFNQTQYCISGIDTSFTQSDTTQEALGDSTTVPTMALSSFTPPLPGLSTCEALQAIARSSDVCRVSPNSCLALQCYVNGYYRVNVAILPCEEIPTVIVAVYHLLEKLTLLHEVYTGTKQESVYLRGETRLFNMAVSIDLSPNKDYISLMVCK